MSVSGGVAMRAGTPAAARVRPPAWAWPVVAGAAGTAFAVALIVATWPAAPYPTLVWLPLQAAGPSFLLCGTLLWLRRPGAATGRLMTALGAAWNIGNLQLLDGDLAFALGFCLYYQHTAILGHLVLTLPGGRLRHPYERRLVAGLYAAPVLTQACRFVAEYPPQPQGWGDPAGDYSVWAPIGSVTMLVLTGIVVGLLARRWVTAGRAVRREYAPVWLALVGLGAATAIADVAAIGHSTERSTQIVAAVYAGTVLVVPIAVAAGLLRVSLARLRVAELVVRLQTSTAPEELRAAIAAALGDPGLDIWYRQPGGDGYVDAAGRPVGPGVCPGRHATPVGDPERPTAILVHDDGLADQPVLVDAVVAAARLALDNARLVTDQRALLDEVRASRARVVLAADAERQRIQRDLHDGVQHELLALSMLIGRARDKLVRNEPPTAELDLAAGRLPEVVRDVRGLTEGIHPPALAEQGLAVALEAVAERAPIPVVVDVPHRRWPDRLERVAYFVATEALSNVYKHAAASHARVQVTGAAGRLSVSVTDDGCGGADDRRGTGLRGLRDRVGALGGTIRVISPPGAGTTVTVELPCAW